MIRTMMQGEKLESRACQALRFSGIVSTPDVDSYKSVVIDPDFSIWLKNPIITHSHDTSRVIGIGLGIEKTAAGEYRITGRAYEEDTRTQIADKRLRGLSIGFDPTIKTVRVDGTTVYIRPIVAEVGVCPLPSNMKCMIDTVSCETEGTPE